MESQTLKIPSGYTDSAFLCVKWGDRSGLGPKFQRSLVPFNIYVRKN